MFVRLLLWLVAGFVTIAMLGAGLFFYLLWTPAPVMPHLSGRLSRGAIEVAGLTRTYALYTPRNLPRDAPLVIALHGSDGSAAQVRIATGYGFERLADQHGFAVAYPNAWEGNWNGCNIVGDFVANQREINDVGFLNALVDGLVSELGSDHNRVFAVGVSRGGQMAYRLALEAPQRFRAVAAIAANVPTRENFKCRPSGHGTPSVMIMNGVEDPLNPFNGGEVQLYGLYRRGTVRSSRASGQFFADLNHIAGAPIVIERQVTDAVRIEDVTWRNQAAVEVELIGIHGSGHGIPQPYARGPRLLGPLPSAPNGPALIWSFFERQSHIVLRP
ncbi:MAG: PHB depolymerase family esterase [Vitreimonas sp.]